MHIHLLSFGLALVTSLTNLYFSFCSAYEASASELTPDDTFVGLSEPEGTSLSMPYIDLISVGF
jgi:hypothetical protein